MAPNYSRRHFLGAAGGAALLPLATGGTVAADHCTAYESLSDTLASAKDSLAATRDTHESLTAEVSAYEETIAAGRDEARGPHPFSEQARVDAGAVGKAARSGMVFLELVGGHDHANATSVTTATAWFVDDHLLLTNNHNVSDVTEGTKTTFWTVDGTRHEFEVVDREETSSPDVALLRTDATAPQVLETGSSESLSVGDKLVQIGNPGGFGKWVLTLGELESRSDLDLTSSVPGLKGVSGSPVLDMDGLVVGMTYGGRSRGEMWTPGTRPEPADPTVHIHPLVPTSQALHVPIEAAMAKLEEWTGATQWTGPTPPTARTTTRPSPDASDTSAVSSPVAWRPRLRVSPGAVRSVAVSPAATPRRSRLPRTSVSLGRQLTTATRRLRTGPTEPPPVRRHSRPRRRRPRRGCPTRSVESARRTSRRNWRRFANASAVSPRR